MTATAEGQQALADAANEAPNGASGFSPGDGDEAMLVSGSTSGGLAAAGAYVSPPTGSEVVAADGPGPFVTRLRYRLPDGHLIEWTSRSHRKGHGRSLGTWIAVLFMVGSTCFAVGSVAGYRGLSPTTAYGPTKAAVINLAEALRNDLAARGIKGFTSMLKHHAERAPLRRNVELEEIANAALFLLSPMSAGITGEVMFVDGGYNIIGL